MTAPRRASFLVRPLDTAWLRDGKPFTAGEASDDPGLFPPTPWTWQGMIRTRMLIGKYGKGLAARSQAQIAAEIGSPGRLPSGWRFWGPFPAQRGGGLADEGGIAQPWVPVPSFVALQPQAETSGGGWQIAGRSFSFEGLQGGALSSSTPKLCRHLMGQRHGYKGSDKGWMRVDNLVFALLGRGRWDPQGVSAGEKRAQGGADLPPFVYEERRPGVAIGENGRAADSMLYFATHHRFVDGSGLWGAVEGAPAELGGQLCKGSAALGRKERLIGLEAAEPSAEFSALLAGSAALAAPWDADLHVRVVLLSPSPQLTSMPFALPEGATLMGAERRAGPDLGGFDRYGAAAGRPSRAMFGAGSSFWVHLPAANNEVDRAKAVRHLLGLEPDLRTDDESLGFGQRVGAPFDPCTGEPATGGPHGS
ncbi:MAG: hypothetical protein JNM72_14315 [Deltaproteobacteria bacterium]|nr:hypothetical protein [Deltaproteobacteria bacterium]